MMVHVMSIHYLEDSRARFCVVACQGQMTYPASHLRSLSMIHIGLLQVNVCCIVKIEVEGHFHDHLSASF